MAHRANSATQLATDRDLLIGDLEVPAGTYTLWSTYTEDSATLIVNSQTNLWGTDYDGSHDFGRTAMTRSDLTGAVERFTISIEEEAEGGVLHFEWDRTRYSVPIRVR